ncbi:NAD(P)H-dependent oxidoreductase [Phenylobacterium sp. LH3H17]|uniref:NADPH-dependent FMN reductase n=1 Tax=Phenylobacterium sp. LH3H17 TaxID=2903901 RepID=UPI0020C992F7|nr:NAD(P)H-dependent oxidoreductase [Phenylobacterium sp. LH3H17]UTP37650.1 NAD(P)H-dependent oxidoreductase [Phenylobacterium sp. LH3H17]
MKLNIVICSTRPGRIGPSIGRWFHGAAQAHGGFEAELVDLAAFNLPVFDEPHHPRLRNYQHDHTKAWSASVEAADAFVFVTPEYNFSPPPAFVNALNYLFFEWNHKPASFVSYGGASGGLRAVQMEKLMLTSVKIMPIPEAVAIPMVGLQIDAEKVFTPTEGQAKAAPGMLDELARWAGALKPLRA